MPNAHHDSVLLSEAVEALRLSAHDVVVDATLGGAGHFAAIAGRLGSDGVVVGIDADQAAVERAREAYARDRRPERPVAHLITDNFRNLSRILERLDLARIDAILFDLGWSGYQLGSLRGFSFQEDEPLYMTYAEQAGDASHEYQTAADLVNRLSEDELTTLLRDYGEERFARPIARSIVRARAKERILTTGALVKAIEAGVPAFYRQGKIHPATKTFQALRIAVNDELGSLVEGLESALAHLAPEGRLAVISFHSIEDRIVKQVLHKAVAAGQGELSPKKPITPSAIELSHNRRARSAKLRIFVRAVHETPVSPTHAPELAYA